MAVNNNRILDAARWRPPQRVLRAPNEAGIIIEAIEKIPGTRHERWLNPAGVVVSLSLGNANAIAEDARTPYYDQIKAAKLGKGWIPWGRCPVAMLASQELSSRNIKCEELLQLHPDPACASSRVDSPCKHALAEQAHRKAKHERREADKAASYKAEAERDREQRERHHDQTLQALREGQTVTAEALRALLERMTATPQPEPPAPAPSAKGGK